MTEKLRKTLITALKIAVSAVLVYFIFTKIDLKEVLQTLRHSHPGLLVAATLLFVLSKILSAFRLQLYWRSIGASISQTANLQLYALGMFYNLFLPGGIGGDAYKGYVLQKHYTPNTKKVIAVLLLDRLSGMVLLLSYACLLALLLNNALFRPYTSVLIGAIPLGLVSFWWMHRRWFPYALPIFWKSLAYSATIQLLQLLCVLCLLQSLAITAHTVAYLLVFLVSSLVSVIPLTLGGIGSRELTFLYGAQWLGLAISPAISTSLTFFLITALTSLLGIVYHFKKNIPKQAAPSPGEDLG